MLLLPLSISTFYYRIFLPCTSAIVLSLTCSSGIHHMIAPDASYPSIPYWMVCRSFLYFLISMRKVVPLSISDDLTKIRPLWYSSMILLANDKPNPHPRFLVVNPGLKTLRMFFFLIPLPLHCLLVIWLLEKLGLIKQQLVSYLTQ